MKSNRNSIPTKNINNPVEKHMTCTNCEDTGYEFDTLNACTKCLLGETVQYEYDKHDLKALLVRAERIKARIAKYEEKHVKPISSTSPTDKSMTETELAAFKEGYYFLYSKDQSDPVLVDVYLSPSFGYKVISFNSRDGGGVSPLSDLAKDSFLIPVKVESILLNVQSSMDGFECGKVDISVATKIGTVELKNVNTKINFTHEYGESVDDSVKGMLTNKQICKDTIITGTFSGKVSEGSSAQITSEVKPMNKN